MRIKLILASSPNDALRKRDPFVPLALPLLAGSAPDHEYELIDLLWESMEMDYDSPVDLVGISVRMTAEAHAYRIAEEFRKRKVKVVLGGPQVSAVPHRAIEHADSVVVGEAEGLWPVLVSDAMQGTLKDFYVCSPGDFDPRGRTVFKLGELPSLDRIPAPARGLLKRRYVFDTVFASRGCPIDCDFCSVPSLFGKETRLRPVSDVVAEIAGFKRYYYLLDDNIFGRPSTYDYYLELYEAVAGLKKTNYWTGQANLDAATSQKGREVIERAVRAGLLYAAVGMESINPTVLRKSGAIAKTGLKNAADVISRLKDHIAYLQDLGVIVSGWFVIGYEDDTIDTFYETYEFCRETSILPVLSPVNALPGTRLYTRLQAEGKLDNTGSLTNFPHPSMDAKEVVSALDQIVEKGYSPAENRRRTLFYMRKFSANSGNRFQDKVHKTIFTAILQRNMGKILRAENDNLRSGTSQNYNESGEELSNGLKNAS